MGSRADMGWRGPMLAAGCAVAGVLAVAGEKVAMPEAGVLTISDDLCRLAALVGDSTWATPCCLLGFGLWLLFASRPDGAAGSSGRHSAAASRKPQEAQAASARLHHLLESPALAEEAAVERAKAPSKKASGHRSHRSCFLCGFLEECMEPAAEAPAPAPPTPEAARPRGCQAPPDAMRSLAHSPGRPCADTTSLSCEAARALRERLSDLLGPPAREEAGVTPAAAPCADAAETVARFGGEESCFHRFLHAKRHNVAATEAKLRKTVEWRRQVGANDILTNPRLQEVWALLEPVWPEKVIGTTRDGSPIVYFDTARAIQTCQLDLWVEANVQTFYVAWMERSLQSQREGRWQHGPCGGGNNMPATVVVYNLKDVRPHHVFRCVKGLATFLKILGMIDEHYPENLRKGVIINVPCIFYKMIWPLVQKVLDARTLANLKLSEGEDRVMLSEALGVGVDEVDKLLSGVLRDSSSSSSS